jgi:hypothetical protein
VRGARICAGAGAGLACAQSASAERAMDCARARLRLERVLAEKDCRQRQAIAESAECPGELAAPRGISCCAGYHAARDTT